MTEPKTLEELIIKFTAEVTPNLDDIANRIMQEHPELVNRKEGSIMLGRFLAIGIMDVLVYLYGKGARGYIPPHPIN